MSADLEEQEDELLALQSIFDEREFVRDQSKFSGKIRVSAELPAGFTVVLKEGESQRQYQVSFLPPLLLTFDLPEDYPSSSPPSFSLTCSWLTHTQLSALSTQLVELHHETEGAVVLFSWVQFLREDALKFLGICNELEVPSDGDNSLQDKHNAAAERERNHPLAPDSQPADSPCDDAPESCKLDICAPATVLPSGCTDSQQTEDLLHEGELSASGQLEESAEGAASLLAQVLTLVGEELFHCYDRLLLQTSLDCMSDVVYCPRPSCASAVIQESSSVAMCSVCSFAFCVKCKKTYHGPDDCEIKKPKGKYEKESWQYLALPDSEEGRKALFDDYSTATRARRRLMESRYGRHTLVFSLESGLSESWVETNSKPCPHCFTKIQKNGGCNRMMCTQCNYRFCWACLTIFTSKNMNTHYQGDSCQVFSM